MNNIRNDKQKQKQINDMVSVVKFCSLLFSALVLILF